MTSAGDVNGDGYADLLVSAPTAGHAHVYFGGPHGLGTNAIPSATLSAPAGSTSYARAAAAAGDVDGDGYGDVVIAVQTTGSRVVYLYRGGSGGLSAAPASILAAPDTAGSFGARLSGANDFDGDGFADVAVSATDSSHNSSAEKVYVYRGGAGALSPTLGPSTTLVSSDPMGGMFGCSIAGATDINGDGFSDLVAAACSAIPGSSVNPNGKVYVFHGGGSGIATTASGLAQNPLNGVNDVLGFATALVTGDVNGDGYGDLLVGDDCDPGAATQDGRPYCGRGLAYIYVGGAAGIGGNAPAATTLLPPSSFTEFTGFASRAALADIDGDGFADAVLAAPQANTAFVFAGTSAGVSTTIRATLNGPDPNSSFGDGLF